MLTIACVQVGNYQKRGADYVNRLAAMVRRHLTVPHRFVCLTDDAAGLGKDIETIAARDQRIRGWWCKLELFKPGIFPKGSRILYLDLDTVILANIDDLARYQGAFAGLGCFRAHRIFASGLMAWEAGSADYIWTKWVEASYPLMGGADDVWIDHVAPHAVRIQRHIPGIVSYKYHKCHNGPPEGARIVVFQRQPKPHNCGAKWIADHWKED